MTSLTSPKVHNSDLRMSKAQEPSPPNVMGGGNGSGETSGKGPEVGAE